MTREDAIKVAYGIPVTKAQHEALQFLIPELAESEDERIRKDIIAFLQSMNSHCVPTQDWDLRNRWLPYLEKQKEQSLRDFIDDFPYSDQKEQKPAEWSEEDNEILQQVIADIEDLIAAETSQGFLNKYNKHLEWLKSIRPQYKQEWSEEDEENFKWFDKFFRAESVVAGGRDMPQDKYLWFKSFRSRPKSSDNWKPSEEQMNELYRALIPGCDYDCDVLQRLYFNLKKLMEE